MDHTNQPREPTAETRSVAAKKFYLVAELVDLNAEAVELDFVLPVVTGRHGVGEDWATGPDEPREHAQFLKEQAASRHWVDRRKPLLLLRQTPRGLSLSRNVSQPD